MSGRVGSHRRPPKTLAAALLKYMAGGARPIVSPGMGSVKVSSFQEELLEKASKEDIAELLQQINCKLEHL